MSSNRGNSQKPSDAPRPLRPSSSVLLVSPENQILLLHRVRTSSSFPSAHVFPGGNVDAKHDGQPPDASTAQGHEDGPTYRLAAIRETFEESGILLARSPSTSRLAEVSEDDREAGRKAVHSGQITFGDWLASQNATADTDGLIPFTRWVTPPNVPKRFTTQMYIYFLPLSTTTASSTVSLEGDKETVIPKPTPDGGVEHTAARFLPAWKWLSLARQNRIILFPPQFLLLHLVGQFLAPEGGSQSHGVYSKQREDLLKFVHDPTVAPAWGEKCISPLFTMKRQSDGRAVLDLNKPGKELQGFNRAGDPDRVVLVNFKKEGPRDVDVRWRKEVFDEERAFEREKASKEKL